MDIVGRISDDDEHICFLLSFYARCILLGEKLRLPFLKQLEGIRKCDPFKGSIRLGALKEFVFNVQARDVVRQQ